mmetsp:Transcript_4863/g.6995  ORF Transcript_4863/g.6995 Transcript_4863/m.6995 type:complete len:223 (+) Transcript_4863:42-710(+)
MWKMHVYWSTDGKLDFEFHHFVWRKVLMPTMMMMMMVMMMVMMKTTITSVFDPSYKKVTYKKNIRIMRMNHHLRTIRQLFLTLISFILLLQAPFTSSIVTPESYIQKTPVVICPGFGNDQIDYIEPLKQPREKGFLAALERRGFDPSLLSIVPIQRRDWLRVAGGLTDWNFYTGNALPTGASYGWYIQRLKQTVDEAYENSGGIIILRVSVGCQLRWIESVN